MKVLVAYMLAGVFFAVLAPLPASGASFDKMFALQGIRFHVVCKNAGSINTLRIVPAGLEIDNSAIVRKIDGTVIGADVADFRVELIVGKVVQVDAKNRYFFGGQLKAEVVEGWGFTQYRLTDLGPMGGTLMAVDPHAAKVSRFVSLGGDPYFVRYNSRLPIVVYVPEGVEVRYRIWTAGPEMVALEKG